MGIADEQSFGFKADASCPSAYRAWAENTYASDESTSFNHWLLAFQTKFTAGRPVGQCAADQMRMWRNDLLRELGSSIAAAEQKLPDLEKKFEQVRQTAATEGVNRQSFVEVWHKKQDKAGFMVMVRPCQISNTHWNHLENAWETNHLWSACLRCKLCKLLQPVTKAENELKIQQVLCRLGTQTLLLLQGTAQAETITELLEMISFVLVKMYANKFDLTSDKLSFTALLQAVFCLWLDFHAGLSHTFSESGSYSAFLTRIFKKSACDAVQLSEVQPIKTMLFQDVFACIDFSANTPAPSFVRTTCYQAVLDGFEVVLQSMPESEQKNMQHLKSAALAIVPGVMQVYGFELLPSQIMGAIIFESLRGANVSSASCAAWQEKILADLKPPQKLLLLTRVLLNPISADSAATLQATIRRKHLASSTVPVLQATIRRKLVLTAAPLQPCGSKRSLADMFMDM